MANGVQHQRRSVGALPYGDNGPKKYTGLFFTECHENDTRAGPLSGGTNVTIEGDFFDTGFMEVKGADDNDGIFEGCRMSEDNTYMVCTLIEGDENQILTPKVMKVRSIQRT